VWFGVNGICLVIVVECEWVVLDFGSMGISPLYGLYACMDSELSSVSYHVRSMQGNGQGDADFSISNVKLYAATVWTRSLQHAHTS